VDSDADPIAAQQAYYADTATTYDASHERGEHFESLQYIASYLRRLGARSALDTGCGTGLALRYLRDAMPELKLRGNDPSRELLEIASTRFGIPPGQLDLAGSEALPYDDGEFDAVIETGMLHHVPDPSPIVSEMLRVARKAIFISDENTFGMGSATARAAKLILGRVGLLDRVNRRRRGSKDWYYTEGDGVAWTYSVYYSLPVVRAACAEVKLIPVGMKRRGVDRWPRALAPHLLLAGFKQPLLEANEDET
jgi:ubiquinone/menaquinone biosynthesis C-methylase UbiE